MFHNNRRPYIDVREPGDDLTEVVTIAEGDTFILHPGEFVLGSTAERVALPDDLVARLEGKSSLGRLGLLIHSTAGYIDPGFDGTITLELSNVARLPIAIYPGMAIGQISFLQMTTPVERPTRASTRGRAGRRPAPTTASSTGSGDPPSGGWRPAGRSQEFAISPAEQGEGERPRRRHEPVAARAGHERRRLAGPRSLDDRASTTKQAWMT